MTTKEKFLWLNIVFIGFFLTFMMLGIIDNTNYWSVRVIIYCCLVGLIQLENRNWEYRALMLGSFAYMASNFLLIGFGLKIIKQYSLNLAMLTFMGNFVLLCGIIYLILQVEGQHPFEVVGFNVNQFDARKALEIAALFCIFMIVVKGLIYFLGMNNLLVEISNYYFRIPEANLSNISFPFVVLAIVYTVILAPVFEEIFFRGFLFNFLADSLHPKLTAVFISLVFAVIHKPGLIINMFFLGLILTYIYKREQNLLYPILAHMLYNLVMVII